MMPRKCLSSSEANLVENKGIDLEQENTYTRQSSAYLASLSLPDSPGLSNCYQTCLLLTDTLYSLLVLLVVVAVLFLFCYLYQGSLCGFSVSAFACRPCQLVVLFVIDPNDLQLFTLLASLQCLFSSLSGNLCLSYIYLILLRSMGSSSASTDDGVIG